MLRRAASRFVYLVAIAGLSVFAGPTTASFAFSDARTIDARPFDDFVDLTAASMASRSGFGGVVFDAAPGTTYYLQLGRGSLFGGSAPMSFHLGEAPSPVANFGVSRSDPSTFDAVHFNDFSFDPAQVDFVSWDWQFGDGTSGAGTFASHHHAADGD
jgi:hypothetical protein